MEHEVPVPAAPAGGAPSAAGRPRRWVELTVLLAALGAALAAAALWGTARSRPGAEGPRGFDVAAPPPAPAPEFVLPDLAGRPVHLADFRGRVVLLNFWASWCTPCRDEIPAMQAVAETLAPRGLVLLAVDYQESVAAVAPFAREVGLRSPVLLDADGTVAERYRVVGLPATFFVDRQGRLVGRALGYRDWRLPAARAYVERLLGEG